MDQQISDTKEPTMDGVIWITGYSAAGKTTIGRKVEAGLRDRGLPTVFLDGDDLRSIFGANWGSEREQRIDLARVYFRLCSHLASQGLTVVISAVAMYEDVYDWVRTNIPRSLQVYLDVPEDERRRRDSETKKVYSKSGDFTVMYDEPQTPDLILQNFGGSRPEDHAQAIIDHYVALEVTDRDMGREDHWRDYYSKAKAPADPSPFAEAVAQRLEPASSLLEIGCGNGRDASYFAREGFAVTALDLSEAAIEKCKVDHADLSIRFLPGKISDVQDELGEYFDAAYSRFVIHAMPVEEEIETISSVFETLKPGGDFHIECRSINDPMAREGEVISPTERIHGHYRRFIIREELEARLGDVGFDVVDSLESNGLAVFGDQDPVVIRIVARKPA